MLLITTIFTGNFMSLLIVPLRVRDAGGWSGFAKRSWVTTSRVLVYKGFRKHSSYVRRTLNAVYRNRVVFYSAIVLNTELHKFFTKGEAIYLWVWKIVRFVVRLNCHSCNILVVKNAREKSGTKEKDKQGRLPSVI